MGHEPFQILPLWTPYMLTKPWTHDIQHHSASFSTSASLQREHVKLVKLVAMPRGIQSHSATPGGIGCDAGPGCPAQTVAKKVGSRSASVCFGLLDDLKMIVEISWKIWLKVSRSFENRKDMNGCHIATFLHMQNFLKSKVLGPAHAHGGRSLQISDLSRL